MTAEHYLSAYLTPPGELSVLSPRHDQNLALWRRTGRTVELVRLWELERISGQKHHFWPLYTPERARALLSDLLAAEGLGLADIRASWGTPGLPGHRPIPVPPGAGDFPVHSLGHLFSGLLRDTRVFREGTVIGLAVDGAPDHVQDEQTKEFWYAGCLSRRGEVSYLPVESPGPLYTAAETLFGKEPGTLMALATACRTEIAYDTEKAAASVRLYGGRTAPWQVAHRLVRGAVAEARRQLAGGAPDPEFSAEENLQSAVMKIVQRCCELVAIRNVERLLALGDVRPEDCHLATSGGFALNCPTNSLLMDHFGFRSLLTPPSANDSGQALGLGLLALHTTGLLDGAELRVDSAYYGNPLRDTDRAIAEFEPWIESVEEFTPEAFVQDVTDGVIAWVDGAAEIGPRALGHRSLLGDPRSAKVKDRLNDLKQRQWWRPVAPIVLADHAGDWFEGSRPSPYMLETVQVPADARDRVPAVLHLDGSARHQCLTAQANPRLYRAIDAFREVTGVALLCNTSLNDKGEPIVDTAAEALTFCVRKGLGVAYIDGRRIALRPGPEAPAGPRPRATAYFAGQEADRAAHWQSWLDRGYTQGGMFLLSRTPGLRTEPAAEVNALAEQEASVNPGFALMVDRFCAAHGPGRSFLGAPGELPARMVGMDG
ncbi:carbamoyltransferase C-terminal domain-containing protein [Streptomyces sp. NPDC005408]|uniref:carbamoyltransferase C-terminal domain-containing protein n=1 Tax=Streptomyces sp. NPDC005408 TaxID=3155341 RepID=UPI0033BA8119